MNYSLSEALKYQQRERLSVAQIHPSLRFTRLGAVLREHATAPDDVGALAHQALTSDHSQPLELMPLHLLKDRMQEEPDHPLAKEFNWERVPEGVQLDTWLKKKLGEEEPLFASQRASVLSNPVSGSQVKDREDLAAAANAEEFDGVTEDHIRSSAGRVYTQLAHRRYEVDGVSSPHSREKVHSTLIANPNPDYRY